jgi:hypothetical protein
MTDNELLTRIIVLVDGADKAQDELVATENATGEDDSSTAIDIDYDTYQEIHRLLRVNGRLVQS